MTVSWRDSTSAECQQDFDALLDQCIDIAANNLVRNWGLDPTAVVIDTDGHESVMMTDDRDGSASRDSLVKSLRDSAESIRSYAVVARVEDTAGQRFLEVSLEHREIAIQTVFPYSIPDTSTFDLGTPRAAVAQHRLFVTGA
ncbi:hypothetical protein [Mycobacteroides abscessus]|uniref:hypothetical protein n=1 Tax=Mycobacteroides abscessus TaxID=36809 RepID=UPI00036855D3|nr:hypothetical protein [Mycobacteroides abscessus]